MAFGKRRNIRITAKATRRTAANTAQANALLRQQAAADTAARQHEHEFRYATDAKYRMFCDAKANYDAEMSAYHLQVTRERSRTRIATLAAIIVVPTVFFVMGVLMMVVWSWQRVQSARTHQAVTYWQRAPLQAQMRKAIERRRMRELPPQPQMAALPQ